MKPIAFATLFVLAGCTVGPDYSAPKVGVPSQYVSLPKTASDAPLSRSQPDQSDISEWWTMFHDSELSSLIAQAMTTNLDLMSAASRVRDAREQEIEAGAAGLPHLNASALGANVHSNSNVIGSSLGGGAPVPPGTPVPTENRATNIKLYSLGFDATWEIDVFGGVRRSVEAAHASTEAALWDFRDAQVLLTSEIATNYLSLRVLQARIAILKDEAKRQTATLEFIRARRLAGFVTELDVNQQVALEESTVAQIPSLEASAGAAEHAIAILLAKNPGDLVSELERAQSPLVLPQIVSVGLPSDLLRRRPDVREAERKLGAATAQIGVAVADLYPKFDLLGGASLASNHLSTLFTGNSLGAAGVGSVVWPIFHGGQIRANIGSKEEEANEAYVAYKKAILTAMQDVEDALLRYGKDQERLLSLQRAALAARSSSDIATAQYRAGLIPYVNVLTAQANDLTAEDQLEQGYDSVDTDLASLFKALGGGWSETVNVPEVKRT